MRISYLLVLKKPLQFARGAMTQTPERNATEPGLKMPKTGSFGKQSRAGSSPKETAPTAPGGLRLGPPFPRVAKRKAFMIGVNEVVSGAKSAKSAMTAAAEKANAVSRKL
jgi:hypothetical protein